MELKLEGNTVSNVIYIG